MNNFINTEKSFYLEKLENKFYPYWEKYIDNEYGGILNCISNTTDELVSTNKYSWSQGRFLYIQARLLTLIDKGIVTKINKDNIISSANKTIQFIKQYVIDSSYKVNFLLSQTGNRIIEEETGRYDSSIYADCFILLGLVQWAIATNNDGHILLITNLFKSIKNRIADGDYLTQPYPIAPGYKAHGINMIMLNTTYEMLLYKTKFNLPTKAEESYALSLVDEILSEFTSNNLIREFISTNDNENRLIIDRHINPGHTLEDLWFIYETLAELNVEKPYMPILTKIAKTTFNLGWDKELGGIFRYADKEGGAVKGISAHTPFETLIESTWDYKLWWPHSEALYLFLLLYHQSNDDVFLKLYKKVKDYSFATFPNSEDTEWTQIRQRDGKPIDEVVALPVKDPFHIMRAFINIIEF